MGFLDTWRSINFVGGIEITEIPEEERVREWEEWDVLKRKMIEDREKEDEARERRRQKRKKAT